MKKLFSLFASFLFIFGVFFVGHQTDASLRFAAGTKYYVPVTITNSQSSATPSPFQSMVSVNSSNYSGTVTPVAYDTSVSGGSQTSPLTLSITVGNNNNRILMIGITVEMGGGASVTSVTVNGNAATGVSSVGNTDEAYIYYYLNPPVGSNSVVISTTDPTNSYANATVSSFYNVNQSSPIGATNSSASATTLSLTPNQTGSMIFGEASDLRGASATGANQTLAGNSDWEAASYSPTNTTAGSAVTFSYGSTSNQNPKSLMAEILPYVSPSGYLASNLQNVNWQDGAGNILNSWLESGNTNSATTSVYWIKLPNSIPANSSVTIYLCFYATSVNNFNTSNTGEAPTLSGTYGQYDNGANVFSNYWNFAGTSLPSGWSAIDATVSVSNGVTITTNTGYNWIGAYTTVTTPNSSIIDTYAKTTSVNSNYGFDIATQGVSFQNSAGGPPSAFYFGTGGSPISSPTANGANGGTGIGGTMFILSAVVVSGAPVIQANYSTQVTGTYSITTPTQIGIGSSATNSAFFQWLRTRLYPPSGVMPADSFGSVTVVSTYHKIILIM